MNLLTRRRFCSLAMLTAASLSLMAATPANETAKIVSAANAFLASLDTGQRRSVMYAFDDQQQRARWSNLPTSFVPRGGIALKDLTPAQQTAAMNLVASALSKKGYEKVLQIMGGDEVLTRNDNGPGNRPPPRGNGGPPPGGPRGAMFGKNLYYISLLGTPSEKTPWMLQFGGHHLALNVTIAGDQGILTPTLTGAQPALYSENGKTVRPLGPESDTALALLDSLDDNQKKQAVLSYELADLVLGPGQDGKKIQPEGLKASAMNDKQRAMLLDVISQWANIINDSAAAARMEQLKADIHETWFAWSGPVTGTMGKNITAYYRIQGPHLVIEYAPQTLGGDPALHVHTMYRDPTNDYGKGMIKQ
ncbi:MAG: DUF3500 domain-containing protein [Acidobacteriaceae bacterium]